MRRTRSANAGSFFVCAMMVLMCLMVVMSAAGCSMIEGAAKDVQSLSQALRESGDAQGRNGR